jgi:hexosaminidase
MAMTNSLGLTNSPGVSALQKYQAWFTQQIANYIHGKGRTMMGWSEIMNGGVVTNCILQDWQNGNTRQAAHAATNGQPVVISASAIYYINKYEHPLNLNIWSNEPPGQAGDVPLSAVYSSDPATNVPTAYTNYVWGIETPNWSEFIPCLMNLEFKAFPRLCAAAEVGWTPVALRNFTDFTNRLELHKLRLKAAGINYNTSITPPVIGSWSSNQITTSFSTLEWDVTTNLTSAGEFDVSFAWKAGTTNGLLLQWGALIENEIDRDTHQGWSGYVSTTTSAATNAVYILRLPALRPSATYKLRASVLGTNGINSYGLLYKPNWN